MDQLRLTVLMENTARRPGLAAENGLSILLQREGRALLFDCGDSGAFLDNARALGEDLSRVGPVVLSHNHYDHTRGFLRFAREHTGYTLYLGRRFFKACYWDDEHEPGLLKPTHGPLDPWGLTAMGVNWRLASAGVLELPEFPGAYLVGGFPRRVPFEAPDPTNLAGPDASALDLYEDEQALVVRTRSGLLLLTGCAHAGVLNILSAVRERFREPVSAIVGGTHLVAADHRRAALTVNSLATSGVPYVAVCHCTGEEGFRLAAAAGLSRVMCGDSLVF